MSCLQAEARPWLLVRRSPLWRRLLEQKGPDILGPSGLSALNNASAPLDSVGARLVARGLAVALTSPGMRRQLLEDMRDSPFQYHALHLGTYLQGTRGQVLARAAAKSVNLRDDELAQLLLAANAGKGFELVMPRYGDRRKWLGDDPLVVFGTTSTAAQVMAFNGASYGFDQHGATAQVDLKGMTTEAYVAIRPATQDFGQNPEDVRALAPKKRGTSIGEPDENHSATQPGGASRLIACDTSVDPACGGGGGGAPADPGYLILPSGMGYDQCNTFRLGNAIDETCRKELAVAFQPRLVFNSDEPCPWREPAWTVRWTGVSGDEIAIFYALSYYNDCGFRSAGGQGHNGDSEFIIVRVHPKAVERNHWYLSNVTLSAHYGFYIDNSWTGDPPAIEFRPGEWLTRPIVYISWGKHGNYRDTGTCGRGAGYLDDCGRPYGYADVGYVGVNDMGTRAYPTPAFAGWKGNQAGRPGLEAYWFPAVFNGWANDYSSSATAYSQLLGDFGF